MPRSYAKEKFFEALESLVGSGLIQDRLASAALYLLRLEAQDFPEGLRERFAHVMYSLTKCASERLGEGRIHSSTRSLTDEQATTLAREILDIYGELSEKLLKTE